ncbi:toxin-antitoxin system toxin subunit [Brachybacterium subflavum]|uniref:toxin-antitoxin system toxin subunit n=1 Tax=Brachybacterium subflavum TaxID=2585206 RepID=UPI0029D4190C|nr:toxin-antitoxin system toxin subunit [Brachybacterium subflavum]
MHAAENWLFASDLDDENPQRELRLGSDLQARLLELVVLMGDDGTEEVIHAMPARKQYVTLLE